MKLIVGLGNPGYKYVWTRHNAGFIIVDSFIARLGLGEPQLKFRAAYWGPVMLCGERAAFLEPQTYMNLSGLSVGEAAKYMNLAPSDILIISDDVALPFGRVRMRRGGSAGGQNGLKSVLGALGTLEVPRFRVGVGSPNVPMDLADWVLAKIPQSERRKWDKLEDVAWDALNIWLADGIEAAMSRVNSFRLNGGE